MIIGTNGKRMFLGHVLSLLYGTSSDSATKWTGKEEGRKVVSDTRTPCLVIHQLWDDTVIEGGRRFMAEWMEEEESAAITRQRKREAEEADKVVVASGVTVGQLRRFRAALLGPSLAPLKRQRLLQ